MKQSRSVIGLLNIVITNIVVLNGGDGAILFGMIRSLRCAFGDDCRIIVYASEPAAAKRMYPEIEFRETLGLAATRAPRMRYVGRIVRTIRSAWYRLAARGYACGIKFMLPGRMADLRDYATADLVVSSGGTYLKEEYGLVSQICDYRMTLALKRDLALFTQTLGPFTQSRSQEALRPVFNAAKCILLRDERSRKNLTDIGVKPDHIHLCADAAFALADEAVLQRARTRTLPSDRPLRIAISLRHWPHFKSMSSEEGMARYIDAFAQALPELLRRRPCEITFLSTCQGNPEYNDDSKVAEQVVAKLDPATAQHVKVVHEFVRFDELMKRLPEFDLTIATRMHMAILSLMSGTPVLPVACEFKTQELFVNLGLGQWVTDIESMNGAGLAERIEAFLNEVPHVRGPLMERVCEFHRSSMQSGSLIRESLTT